jgi:hypothetical protein
MSLSTFTMNCMKTVEYWYWLIPTPTPRGVKLVRTGYRMDEATALAARPGAVKAPGTMELRNVPDTDADLQANFTGAWRQSK